MLPKVAVALCLWAVALAQVPDPAYAPLARAYTALRARDYDSAIAAFEQAVAAAPGRSSIRKDFAYTLLKVGQNRAARDQFAEAVKMDPKDTHSALEYAFLCYETKKEVEARRAFDRTRRTAEGEARATAEQAFQNIDRPLEEGIARWKKAVELSPKNFSAHEELARLAEQRDEIALAAEHYEAAWKLRPDERRFLLDLGRTWKGLGQVENANAALLAASRGAQPRVAETAKELVPARYPYVYEFRSALALDPDNLELRRELAYLLLEMNEKAAAEMEFKAIVDAAPDDLLSTAQLGFLKLARKDMDGAKPLLDRVLRGGDNELADRVRSALKMPKVLRQDPETKTREQIGEEAKTLAAKSLEKGYLKDALKYLTIAHESDPVDFDVMLKLGWTYNMLRQDEEAVKWFGVARRSPDPAISGQAERAWKNLRPQFARFRTTTWMFPFYSSRWRDLFAYAQVKTEMRVGKLPIRPYVSVRFIGDTRGEAANAGMLGQYLSETSFIAAAGIATDAWHGVRGWFEAGEAIKYAGDRKDVGAMVPDYRGGISYTKGFGTMLAGSGRGTFAETGVDGVFVSRFGNDMLGYTQTRTGYTFRTAEKSGWQTQVYWNWNLTADSKGEYWANFIEIGPGVRIRVPVFSKPVLFGVNALSGHYLVNDGNPRGPSYYDLRAGFWYAFSR